MEQDIKPKDFFPQHLDHQEEKCFEIKEENRIKEENSGFDNVEVTVKLEETPVEDETFEETFDKGIEFVTYMIPCGTPLSNSNRD